MWTLRPAAPADAAALVPFLRLSIPRTFLPYTILGCAGFHAYLTDLFEQGPATTPHRFFTIDHDSELHGVAEWRTDGGSLFLNYLYLTPDARGHGLGRRLLLQGIHETAAPMHRTVRLDVFATNRHARAWYAALGFRPVETRSWLIVDLPTGIMHTDDVVLDGLPEADAQHARYGFSAFSLKTPTSTYRIGRLEDGLFRATTCSILSDRAALKALHRFQPQRRLLCIGTGEPPPAATPHHLLGRSLRLESALDPLLTLLTAATP